MGRCHAIDLEITPIVPDENPDAGVCVLLGEIAGSPGEEIETEVVIEGDYEANSFDMALEYDTSDIEVLEITPGEVIQEIVENGGEFDLEQFGPGSGPGEGGSGNPELKHGHDRRKSGVRRNGVQRKRPDHEDEGQDSRRRRSR